MSRSPTPPPTPATHSGQTQRANRATSPVPRGNELESSQPARCASGSIRRVLRRETFAPPRIVHRKGRRAHRQPRPLPPPANRPAPRRQLPRLFARSPSPQRAPFEPKEGPGANLVRQLHRTPRALNIDDAKSTAFTRGVGPLFPVVGNGYNKLLSSGANNPVRAPEAVGISETFCKCRDQPDRCSRRFPHHKWRKDSGAPHRKKRRLRRRRFLPS